MEPWRAKEIYATGSSVRQLQWQSSTNSAQLTVKCDKLNAEQAA